VAELRERIRHLERELVAVLGERNDALEHAARRHGSERRTWEDERAALRQQLAQETANHTAVSRTLELLRRIDAARGDVLTATGQERDAARHRLAHDADLHAVALMDLQESVRDLADRAERLQQDNDSLRRQLAAAAAELERLRAAR
jgi:CheY-like chemotaxis protein